MATTICMAVYSTEDNGRAEYTKFTLEMLLRTCDFNKHSLIISDNGSCGEMHDYYLIFKLRWVKMFPGDHLDIIFNGRNLGTSGAVNKAIKLAREKYGKDQFINKSDDDIDVIYINWLDEIEECFRRDPSLGQINLKRHDLEQCPDHHVEWYRSKLRMLPRVKGESWLIVEETDDLIGTCGTFNPRMLDKIGYMYQNNLLYGWDDAFQSLRCRLSGFKTCFLPHINIRTIDTGGTEFTKWKEEYTGEHMNEMSTIYNAMKTGSVDYFYEPNWEELA